MARRKLRDKSVRNIQKNQRTYYVTLPIEEVKKLGWRERQKVIIKRSGNRFIIEDWKE